MTKAVRKGRRTCDCGQFLRSETRQPPCHRGDVARTDPAAGSPRNDGSDSVEALSGQNQARSSADHVTGEKVSTAAGVQAH